MAMSYLNVYMQEWTQKILHSASVTSLNLQQENE